VLKFSIFGVLPTQVHLHTLAILLARTALLSVLAMITLNIPAGLSRLYTCPSNPNSYNPNHYSVDPNNTRDPNDPILTLLTTTSLIIQASLLTLVILMILKIQRT
jgi:hypothetical protein